MEVSSPINSVPNSEIVTEDDSVEPTMEVKVVPLRRSARDKRLNFLATLCYIGLHII